MAWLATDNFDSYSNGNLSGNTGGTDWSGGWGTFGTGSWEPQVEDTVVLQGAKSISMTPDAGSDRGASRQFSAATSGEIEFKLRRTSNSTGRMYVAFLSTSTVAFSVDMLASGNFGINNSSIGVPYSADTTYTVKVEFDCGTDQVRIAINGGAYSSWTAFMSGVASVNTIRFLSADASSGVTNYFDDVKPYSPVTRRIFMIT